MRVPSFHSPTRSRRGQSSVELIVIMAAALLILGVLVSLVSDQVTKLQNEHAIKLAQSSVQRLVENVNEVYLQGVGATRQVVLTWPEGVDPNQSYILDHSIVVNVIGTTIVGTTKPLVTGSLPVSGGLQSIRLRAFDGFVAIGTLSLVPNPSTVFTALNRDDNSSIHVTLTNASAQSASLVISSDWNHSLVDLNLSSTSGNISGGSTYGMDLNFHAHDTAVGAFAGKMIVQATFPGRVETLIIPLTAQVYTGNTGDLSIYPTTLSIDTFGADTNVVSMQVCNTGVNTLKSISFTHSTGAPGDWVVGIPTLPTLDPLSCADIDVNVTVPEGTALGTSSGTILIKDYSGTNSYIVPLTVNVRGMNSVFSWDWSTASILQGQVSGFRMTNTGTKAIQINSMIVRNWWKCDMQKGNLSTIVANNLQRFSGSLPDGNTANVTDFNIPILTSWLSNALTFAQTINDDNESFIVDVNFSDGTNYSTSAYGTGCNADTNAPAKVSNLQSGGGPEPKDVTLHYTYPGDDQNTGTAVGAIIKYAYSQITDESSWNSAYTVSYTPDKATGGTAGMSVITGLDVGYTFHFAMKFYDENNNYGPLSNSPNARSWNSFQWTQNDFNFTNFPASSALLSNDVNQFRLSNLTSVLSGGQLVFRIFDDGNASNTWIMTLDMNATHLGRIRIWYPMTSEVGIPAATPAFDANTNTSIASTINLLNASLIPSAYRYNGTGVNMSGTNHFYVDVANRIGDFNITIDADYTVAGGGQGGAGGHG
ncbi:MAG: hypothetical protein AABX02_04985 [archaeon]